MLMRILLFIIFILSTAKGKAQCPVKIDTLKCWMVVLTKQSNYKQVRIIECKEVMKFGTDCRGEILGYLDLFKQPLFMDNYYILFKSTTKIRL